jgi:hypothetical protein
MMTTQVALDAFVAVLLLATIVAAWRLDRRLSTLRREKAALAELMSDFGQAAAKADHGLKSLKAAANDVGRDVEALVAKGQGLREDLSFLIERGEPLADRLTEAVRARPAAPPPSAAAPAATAARSAALRPSSSREARAAAPAGGATNVEPRSEIERELLKALAALR